MLKFPYIFCFFLLSLTTLLDAKIVQTDRIATVSDLIEAEANKGACWILVDLDNTLFEAKQALGHTCWFYDEMNKKIASGNTKEEAVGALYPSWIKLQALTEVQPLEQELVDLLKSLQEKGVVVMGLTHRQTTVVNSTLRQVKSIGFDFTKTAPFGEDIHLSGNCPALYTQGILFVGDYNKKSDILVPLLQMTCLSPMRAVFIDDRPKNVEELDEVLPKKGVEHLGIYYTAIDRSTTYHPDLAAVQQKYLDSILSNEAALLLIQKGIENQSW